MACFHPLPAYRSKEINPKTGKNVIHVIAPNSGKTYLGAEFIQVPCGKCIGCTMTRSREWAMRCWHEAKSWESNCFVTLTFRDERLPKDGSVDVRYLQIFMKSLRKKFGAGIRFFSCGEYGEKLSRPHFHLCLFNFDFADKVLLKENNGIRLYIARSLVDLWVDVDGLPLPAPVGWIGPYNPLSYGYSTIGDVTFESAAYVARYCLKKINGDKALLHYKGLKPEFVNMSRRPGIGNAWLNKWVSDVYPRDRVVLWDGFELKPPRYYDNIYDKLLLTDKVDLAIIKEKRVSAAKSNPDNSYSRLLEREVVEKAKAARKEREYEVSGV